ncbi:MAG: DUF4340 domain-containing protein [Anaerolineae bacterium]
MRLNRNSAIFIALLAVVIVVALIFLQDEPATTPDPDSAEATAQVVSLFPAVDQTQITALTISEVRAVDDTRPTPIPGNPTLESPTPLPEGIEAETITEVLSLTRAISGSEWVISDTSTSTPASVVDSARVDSALSILVNLRANRQFIPDNGDYAQYGLDAPTIDIQFVQAPTVSDDDQDAGDAVNYRLQIGDATVGENSYYALLNDDSETVYVVTGGSNLRNSVFSLLTTPPLQPTPTPTAVPVLNVQSPFMNFAVTQAVSFNFSELANGETIRITRNDANTEWVYTANDTDLAVQQESLQVILNSFSTVRGLDQTVGADRSALGLEPPAYRFEAQTNDDTFVLQLGTQDPTGSLYYGLINDFEEVVLIDANSVALLIDLFENPPLAPDVPETTPEAEATAEATEASE